MEMTMSVLNDRKKILTRVLWAKSKTTHYVPMLTRSWLAQVEIGRDWLNLIWGGGQRTMGPNWSRASAWPLWDLSPNQWSWSKGDVVAAEGTNVVRSDPTQGHWPLSRGRHLAGEGRTNPITQDGGCLIWGKELELRYSSDTKELSSNI